MKQIALTITENHPLLLALIRSQEDRQQFMRDLLRRDITDHQGILNSKKPRPRIRPEEDPKHLCMNIKLDEDRDEDIIEHMAGIENKNMYMIGLLYFSIGEIPDEYTHKRGRPTLPKEVREKNRAESLARARKKYLSQKKRLNFFFNYRWWVRENDGRSVIVWFNLQKNKTQFLKDVIRKMIHGEPEVTCEFIDRDTWCGVGMANNYNYSDHFDLILDTEEDADIIDWFNERRGYDVKPVPVRYRSRRSAYVPTEMAKSVALAIADTIHTANLNGDHIFLLRLLADEWKYADEERFHT